jgi:microcystin-dependent protein
MSEAYIGEIRAFGFNYPPQNWMSCSGQLLPISQYTALFSILGISFGGNGTTNFGLPNFQGAVGVGAGAALSGTNYSVGGIGGAPSVPIAIATLPPHTHTFSVAGQRAAGDSNVPGPTKSFAPASGCTPYAAVPPTQQAMMAPTALAPSGTASPSAHNNMAPVTAVNFCICVAGQFPPRG